MEEQQVVSDKFRELFKSLAWDVNNLSANDIASYLVDLKYRGNAYKAQTLAASVIIKAIAADRWSSTTKKLVEDWLREYEE